MQAIQILGPAGDVIATARIDVTDLALWIRFIQRVQTQANEEEYETVERLEVMLDELTLEV